MLAQELDSTLKPLGFLRRKASWNRAVDPFVDVVALQRSKGGDEVTVNVGVLVPKVYELCWGEAPRQFVDETQCTVRTRLHGSHPEKELWWRMSDSDTSESIAGRLKSEGIPFMERMHSLAEMRDFLANTNVAARSYPPPIVYLAILEAERGELTRACGLLRALRDKTSGAWQVKVDFVMARLRCTQS